MITQSRLKELLAYDPETGVFTWLQRRGRSAPAGSVAGYMNPVNRYLVIGVNQRKHYAHRLAFLYMTGEFPPEEVDHINGERTDNRWGNLRAATTLQNRMNTCQRKSKTGARGVRPAGSGFQAKVTAHKKVMCLGTYATVAEAAEVARSKRQELFGEFFRG